VLRLAVTEAARMTDGSISSLELMALSHDSMRKEYLSISFANAPASCFTHHLHARLPSRRSGAGSSPTLALAEAA